MIHGLYRAWVTERWGGKLGVSVALNGVQLERVYLLHRRPYRNSSLILDLFTLSMGGYRLLLKG